MAQQSEKITVVGAGLAGSLLAIFLARRGYEVEVFERRPDMRRAKMSAGRSINLAMSARGLYALEQVGLRDELLQIAIPMRGRMIHGPDGRLRLQPYGINPSEVIHSISRGELNARLMTAAEMLAKTQIHFDQICTGMNFRSGELHFRDAATGKSSVQRRAHVIAADGAASAVRTSMLRVGRFNFSQSYIEHGYKELTMPAGRDGAHQMDKNALHIWPRGGFMLIALPNLDGSFTCTLFLAFEGAESFAQLTTERRVRAFFEQYFPDAVPLMPDFAAEFFANPTGKLVTIRCSPWHVGGAACLLGDAAHAIVPFFGQGMNCAFEDCTLLDGLIERLAPDWGRIFAAFSSTRKPDAEAIADMALENFIEMRDRVADAQFLFQKEVSLELERRFPEVFIPKYALVSFHRVPYAEAQAEGRKQEAILHELCAGAASLSEIDWQRARRLVYGKLPR